MHHNRIAWHIGDILAVITGDYSPAPRGGAGCDALEDYLAGRPLSESERCFFSDAFPEALLLQHPGLAMFRKDMPLPPELMSEWLRRRIAEFGEYLPVTPLPRDHPACTRRVSESELASFIEELSYRIEPKVQPKP